MFFTVYCGYTNFLIVVIFSSLVFLILIIVLLFLIFFINFSRVVVSLKIFNLGFYGDFELYLSIWNFLFILIVILIRIRVIIFSISYISGLLVRNFIFLYLSFVVRIVWLILNNNFYWIIFGWDGLGVVSFLLIVYYINIERIRNGLFTLFQNRLGDLFFVLFLVGLIDLIITNQVLLKWGLIFLIVGRCVKRAQFPFNSWLLAAISAPTPISSLVHSSTLVVAGVYILLQYSYCLFEFLNVLKFISLLSLLIRWIGLLVEIDLKKLIAYSTIRHVSLIIYLLRFQLYKIVYFHLNIHAIFKSLIFMCFGFVMLSSYHSQDKRLTVLLFINPLVKIIYYFSCLCIAGLPFLIGFFSKDLIIEKFIENSNEIYFLFFLLLFLAVRIYYSLKLVIITDVIFVYIRVEKRFLGLFGVIIIIFITIIIVNVYIRLVFSLSLELISYKISIYFFILIFLILALFFKIHFNFGVYSKIINFTEIWVIDYYILDKIVYYHIFYFVNLFNNFSRIKLFLLMNWWVIIIFVVLFYNESLVSVTLKKLRVYYIF